MLLTATGLAWFVPNFAASGVALVAWLAAHALYLHRGPLVQFLVSYPRGRPRGRLEAGVVIGGYVAALATGVWESEPAAIALAVALAAAVAREWLRAPRRERRERLVGAVGAWVFALVVGVTAAARLVEPAIGQAWTLHAYEITMVLIAVGSLLDLLGARPQAAAVTDLVVELANRPSGTQADALARALGDPSLQIGYWRSERQAYVDAAGHPLDLPGTEGASAVTRIDRDGERMAVLVHDPAVLDEPSLVEAVRASAGLAAANARLHAEVREQAAAVEASRLRLLRARDDERRRLDLRLRDGAERRLEALSSLLDGARRRAGPGAAVAVGRARERLDATLADLHELAAGLHPRELSEHGLERALIDLAARSPVPVRIALSLEPLSPEIETAIYFVCSEALANVAKYADAQTVDLEVAARDGAVLVHVRDDGAGGADPASGTGLAGLADRIAVLGGTLRVDSPPGAGTRLHGELPRPAVRA